MEYKDNINRSKTLKSTEKSVNKSKEKSPDIALDFLKEKLADKTKGKINKKSVEQYMTNPNSKKNEDKLEQSEQSTISDFDKKVLSKIFKESKENVEFEPKEITILKDILFSIIIKQSMK